LVAKGNRRDEIHGPSPPRGTRTSPSWWGSERKRRSGVNQA